MKALTELVVEHFIRVETITIRAGVYRDEERLPNDREVNFSWSGRRTGGGVAHIIEDSNAGGLGLGIRTILDSLASKKLKEVRWIQGGLKLAPLAEFVHEKSLAKDLKMEVVEWKDINADYYFKL
jgi:hypothetical protein